jgi:hypothetical protein
VVISVLSRRGAVAGALCAAAAVAGFVVPSPAGSAQCVAHALAGGWSVVTPPQTVAVPTGTDSSQASLLNALTGVQGSTRTLLTTDGSNIYRSADRGCSWATTFTLGSVPGASAFAPYYITNVAAPTADGPGHSRVVYALAEPGILAGLAGSVTVETPTVVLRSQDAGVTWDPVTPRPSAEAPDHPRCSDGFGTRFGISPVDPNVLILSCLHGTYDAAAAYAAGRGGSTTFVLRSADGGASWKAFSVPGTSTLPPTAVADPHDARGVWLLGSTASDPDRIFTTVWHSTDGGKTWGSARPLPVAGWSLQDVHLVAVADGPKTRVALSTPFGVFETTPAARHWTTVMRPRSGVTIAGVFYTRRGAERDVLLTSGTRCSRDIRLARSLRGRNLRASHPSASGLVGDWTHVSVGPDGAIGLASYQPRDTAGKGCATPAPQPIVSYNPR